MNKRIIKESGNELTFKEFMATSRYLIDTAKTRGLMTNSTFSIPEKHKSLYWEKVKEVDIESLDQDAVMFAALSDSDSFMEMLGYVRSNMESEVDKEIAALGLVGQLMEYIEANQQKVTVDLLNNAKVMLKQQYGIDFNEINKLYNSDLQNIVNNVVNQPGFILPTATNQLEFNMILAGKIAENLQDNLPNFTKEQIENILEFSYQLDDVGNLHLIRGSACSNEKAKTSLLMSSKWLEWCLIFKHLILSDNQAFRDTPRFANREENEKSMTEFIVKTAIPKNDIIQ